jgi:hypothetical protein
VISITGGFRAPEIFIIRAEFRVGWRLSSRIEKHFLAEKRHFLERGDISTYILLASTVIHENIPERTLDHVFVKSGPYK